MFLGVAQTVGGIYSVSLIAFIVSEFCFVSYILLVDSAKNIYDHKPSVEE